MHIVLPRNNRFTVTSNEAGLRVASFPIVNNFD